MWRSGMFLEHSIRKVRGSTLVPAEVSRAEYKEVKVNGRLYYKKD
jgi:hypothetical protein